MIPPHRNMTVENRQLVLREQTERPGISHSIDLFFRSLAADLKDHAISVILSGSGSDGTLGVRDVKSEGGLVVVQHPETARYDGMPRAAIMEGTADMVLPADKMPGRIMEYVRRYNRLPKPRQTSPDEDMLRRIFNLVRRRTRHDFSKYKLSTITRRMERRMSFNQLENLKDYVSLLEKDPGEIDSLVKDFLIHVTSFFGTRRLSSRLKNTWRS